MQAHIIGDIHGDFASYQRLLVNEKIVDKDLNWIAGGDHLWLIGDVFDRGHQAVDCIQLTMNLAEQAREKGGTADCILGNHELMFLAARKFASKANGSSMVEKWRRWGGHDVEMLHVTEKQIDWLSSRPAMQQVGDRLLVHSDNLCYVNYGLNIEQVNQYFWGLINSEDQTKWIQVLGEFSQRRGFELGVSGNSQANQLLELYGGKMLVHGHTPISLVVDIEAKEVTGPRIYADGQCCNVDGGIYLGGPGFVYSFATN